MNKIVEQIKQVASAFSGIKVYAVGGFSRDIILGLKHQDIDLAVNKNVLAFSKKLAQTFDSKLALLDNKSKTYRIMLKNCDVFNIDISGFKGKNIEQDLQERDFTVNAIAFEIESIAEFKKHLIFPNKTASKDLKNKTLNAVSPSTFEDDPLRCLRAFRFCAQLNFRISNACLKQIKKYSKNVRLCAPERVKNEFFKILSCQKSCKILKTMDACKLFEEIFKEIKNMKKARKKYYYHPKGLFQHSFETMEAAEHILNNLGKFFPNNSKDLEFYFNENGIFSENITRANLLKFCAFFHDNAKPETAKFKDGKMRFFKHETIGAEKIENILIDLKSGKKDIESAKTLVANHMRPSTLTKNTVITKKAMLKLFRDLGSLTPMLIVLAIADWLSYKRLKVFSIKELKRQLKTAEKIMDFYYEIQNSKPLPKLIDGNIIMHKCKLPPGVWIGELLKIVSEAQSNGKISDEKSALHLVFSKLTHIKKKYSIC
ncbi:MAG: HD domain-containing protein [Elusimicrobiota bacterium]|jgi:poly(A) polymerase|nr:HD domain-containing protein [Elusimicrobiota bacterium]